MENVPTHDVQSQTEFFPLDADNDFSEALENLEEENNSVLAHSQAETMLHCVLSLESCCKETAEEKEQSFNHCAIAVLPASTQSTQKSTLSEQELYNSFHFWRTPLPEIDIDLELQKTAEILYSQTQEGKQELIAPASPNVTMATRKELEEMIENLEPHMDDPDVKGINTVKHF